MKRYFFYAVLLLVICTATRCKKPEIVDPPLQDGGTLVIEVEPRINGQAFTLNKDFQGANDQEYRMSIFRTYLSDIRLVKEDNSEQQIEDVALIDLGQPASTPGDQSTVGRKFTIKIPDGSFKGINMGLGVYKPLNVVKMDYANDHALSVYRGTDWSWAGYRFVMLEGLVKNKQSGSSEAFDYHTALDTFYREMSFPKAITIGKQETKTLKLVIDVDRIFSPADQNRRVDLVTQDFTHTEESDPEQMELSRRITENLKDAISIE